MPCDESDVMRAYRARVKTLHPDRGGDKKQFLLLQKQFEESLDYVRQYADGDPHSDGLSKDL
jgi:curved DNA-binding protein CbpA